MFGAAAAQQGAQWVEAPKGSERAQFFTRRVYGFSQGPAGYVVDYFAQAIFDHILQHGRFLSRPGLEKDPTEPVDMVKRRLCIMGWTLTVKVGNSSWVLEGSLAGFFGCVFEVWPAPRARESPQKCGGRSPPHF